MWCPEVAHRLRFYHCATLPSLTTVFLGVGISENMSSMLGAGMAYVGKHGSWDERYHTGSSREVCSRLPIYFLSLNQQLRFRFQPEPSPEKEDLKNSLLSRLYSLALHNIVWK